MPPTPPDRDATPDAHPAVKAAARQMGFDGGTVRAPVCEVGAEAEAKIAAALAPLKAA